MVNMTVRAYEEIMKLKEQYPPGLCLRIAVQGGGCSGMQYKLSFDQQMDKDKVMDDHDLRIVVDPKSALFLEGVTLDWSGGLQGTGFAFSNPNAKKTCGCGTSFPPNLILA